jgi:anti-sigma B factor antagonist
MAKALVSQRVLSDGAVLLELRGELDIAVNDALRDVLIDTVRNRRPPRLVVSMHHVTFVDSTGIGALLAGYNEARAAGVGFTVSDVAPFVERQLRTAGVYEALVGSGAGIGPEPSSGPGVTGQA